MNDLMINKLWSKRLEQMVMTDTLMHHLLPKVEPQTPPSARAVTKQEKLAEIIGEFMAYDGDSEGAAAAVIEFLSEY